MKKRFYVAYGSNLNIHQMERRCPDAIPIGTSVIRDYELLFKGSKTGSYLTIEPKEGKQVPVGIWAVSEEDEVALDRYEGYPDFYYKKELVLPVRYLSGWTAKRSCFVYIMHEERKIGVPTSTYLNTCTVGYRNFGFDPAPLFDAYDHARKEVGVCERKFAFRWL